MKKIVTFLILFIVGIFLCIQPCDAKDVLKKVNKTDDLTYSSGYLNVANEKYIYQIKYLYHDNYHISTRLDSYEMGEIMTFFQKRNNKNTLIYENYHVGYVVLDLISYNGSMYALVDNYKIKLVKLDENLMIEKSIYLGDENQEVLYETLYNKDLLFGHHHIAVTDNGIGIYTEDNNMILVDNEFKQYKNIVDSETKIEDFFPEKYELNNIQSVNYKFKNYKENSKYNLLSGGNISECDSNTELNECSQGVLVLKDKNNAELWTKNIDTYMSIVNPILTDKYIIAIGLKENEKSSDLIVLDYNGELIQKIENENLYIQLENNSNIIKVTNYMEKWNYISEVDQKQYLTTNFEFYKILNNIETKTDNKGKIEVINEEVEGETVDFKIIPNDGYILQKIIIKDEEGNLIDYQGSKFVMPNKNVTIEATFRKDSIEFEWEYNIDKTKTNAISEVIEEADGYLVYGLKYTDVYPSDTLYWQKIDDEGKLVSEKETTAVCTYVNYVDGKFFCFHYNKTNYSSKVTIYNKELELEDTVTSTDFYDYYYISDRIYEYVRVTDDEYLFINYNNKLMLSVSKDFSSMSTTELYGLTEEEMKKILGEYYILEISESENDSSIRYYYSVKINDSKKLLTYYDYSSKKCVTDIYDNENNVLLSKEYECEHSFEAELLNDGILVAKEVDDETCEDDLCYSHIIIKKYDFYGNEIYTKEEEELSTTLIDYLNYRGSGIAGLILVDTGVLLTTNYERSLTSDTLGNGNILKFVFCYEIHKSINGEGTIEVIESSKPGEAITFKITPKEGYVLGEVKVTDANGNVVVFTDYTFTMPSADVKIEATFIKEETNPITSDAVIILCFATMVIAGFVTIYNYRKRLN